MNTPKTLFTVLNTLIILIILAICLGLVLTGLTLFGFSFESLNIISDDVPLADLKPSHYIFMGLNLVFYIVFVYGLFKLRKVSKLFLNNTFYDSGLGINSGIAGKCFVLSGVFWWLFDGLSALLHFDNSFSIGVSDKTFVYLFFIVMGLFLMLTSKVFDNALSLKNESDLTI